TVAGSNEDWRSAASHRCLLLAHRFQKEFVAKPPPGKYRKRSADVPAEGKPKKEEVLQPLVEGKTVRFAGRPTFIKRLSTASIEGGHFERIRSLLMKESSASRLLPAIRGVPEAQKQLATCQLQGQAGTEGQEDVGQAHGTKHVRFHEDDREADRGARKMKKAKASYPLISGRPFNKDKRSSLRAEASLSKESKGRPSRLPLLARDSVKLLRQRAKKVRLAEEKPEGMAASTSHCESSLPTESSTHRSGLLPPIRQGAGTPKDQPPKTKASNSRQGTPGPC
ncbi:uncharacterized protein LOC110390559, partial [Numida meleagris]|uniref:uncharacterized protein LOC110390559 n=1 Tax=Numida meleagris TaxID=8996 RepID=UPI000B3E0FE4